MRDERGVVSKSSAGRVEVPPTDGPPRSICPVRDEASQLRQRFASAPGWRIDLARCLRCVLRCGEGWSLRLQREPSPTDTAHAGHAWEGNASSPPLVERERGSVHLDGKG